MKERPIFFNGEMVRAILNGRKTQTRRLVKGTGHGEGQCPFGAPGDQLWVRETFIRVDDDNGVKIKTYYRADKVKFVKTFKLKWTPSIHMPRAESRITLKITDVRVEKLKDISLVDAINEGLISAIGPLKTSMWEYSSSQGGQFSNPKVAFQMLWGSINGMESWDSNPWVWVIEFEMI